MCFLKTGLVLVPPLLCSGILLLRNMRKSLRNGSCLFDKRLNITTGELEKQHEFRSWEQEEGKKLATMGVFVKPYWSGSISISQCQEL